MSEKIVLCACSGMNPRGAVTRASVYDLSIEQDDIEFAASLQAEGIIKNSLPLQKKIK